MRYIQKLSLVIVLLFIFVANAFAEKEPPLPTPIGRVVWIKGSFTAVMPSKEERKLQRLSVIYLHDTLITDANSQAQIVFTDNTLMAFRPNTEFFIKDYSFEPKSKKGSVGKSVMNLIQGGFRTITGLIAKDNPDQYQINTPVATIGVRGTEYSVVLQNGELFVGYYSGKPCVTGNKSKSVFCLNEKNKYVKVDAGQQTPVPVEERPAVFDDDLELVPAKISGFNTGSGGSSLPRTGITNSFCISY